MVFLALGLVGEGESEAALFLAVALPFPAAGALLVGEGDGEATLFFVVVLVFAAAAFFAATGFLLAAAALTGERAIFFAGVPSPPAELGALFVAWRKEE